MNFNLSFADESWLYNDHNSSSFNNEPLQEPVPFEDFKFSFGINPEANATPNIGDFPPPIISNNGPTSLDPLFLQQEPFNFATHTVLDENDQKAFSNFLDAFFLDPDMQPDLNDDDEQDQEENRRSSILQSLDEQKKLQQTLNLIASLPPTNNAITTTNATDLMMSSPSSNTNKSIVTSKSENKNNQLQTIYLHSSDSTNTSLYKYYDQQHRFKKRSSPSMESLSSSSTSSRNNKKSRTTKELLTEEEKRANHIASEQKRRSTIRTGFKDLTDLVPTLKNINNSKSTVLFKAVDFIRYLEKRNKHLRDKVGSLELRVEVEGRMKNNSLTLTHHPPPQTLPSSAGPPSSQQQQPSAFNPIQHVSYSPPNTPPFQVKKPATIIHASIPKTQFVAPLSPSIETGGNKRKRSNSNTSSTGSSCTSSNNNNNNNNSNSNNNNNNNSTSSNSNHLLKGLPANARNALLAHKTQQKQLLLLQEQLQMHQRLIAQQQEMKEKSLNQHRQQASHTTKTKLPPILGQYESSHQSSLLSELEDKAISAP